MKRIRQNTLVFDCHRFRFQVFVQSFGTCEKRKIEISFESLETIVKYLLTDLHTK